MKWQTGSLPYCQRVVKSYTAPLDFSDEIDNEVVRKIRQQIHVCVKIFDAEEMDYVRLQNSFKEGNKIGKKSCYVNF